MGLLCPKEKCPHWNRVTKYREKCSFQVQCWRGDLDSLLSLPGQLWAVWTERKKIRAIRDSIKHKR